MNLNDALDLIKRGGKVMNKTAEVIEEVYMRIAGAEGIEDINATEEYLEKNKDEMYPTKYLWLKFILEDHVVPHFISKEEFDGTGR